MFCSAFHARAFGRNLSQRYQQQFGSIARRSLTRTAQIRLPVQPPRLSRTGGYAAPKRPPTKTEVAGLGRIAKIEMIENLFKSGVKALYKAPARLAIFRFQNWILAIVLVGGVLAYQSYGLLSLDEFKRRGMSRIIYFLYMIIAAFMCSVAGILIYRTRNHVHAITLVEQANQVFLKITTRSLIPFVRSDALAIPESLVIRSKMVAPQSMPEAEETDMVDQRRASQSTSSAPRQFLRDLTAATRCFINNEGLIGLDILDPNAVKDAKKEELSSSYKLDTTGGWSVRQGDKLPVLFDIAKVEDRSFSLGFFGLFFKR